MKIAFCAGHGGSNSTPGKRTPDGVYEWNFNNKVALAFAEALSKYENVQLLRTDDASGKTDIPLATRTDKANAWGADIYISFHHNANTGKWGTWTGTETFTYLGSWPKAEKLAELVQTEILKAYGLRDRGLKKANFHIVRETNCPAILIEGGYMDSTIDIGKLRDDNVLKAAGQAVARGVAAFGSLKLKPIPVPVAPKPVVPAPTGVVYTVENGDTLWGISRKFNISVADLKAINKLTSDVIHVGQVLKVSKATYHEVVSGDTLWGLSKKYGVSVADLKAKNHLTSDLLSIGQVLLIK